MVRTILIGGDLMAKSMSIFVLAHVNIPERPAAISIVFSSRGGCHISAGVSLSILLSQNNYKYQVIDG